MVDFTKIGSSIRVDADTEITLPGRAGGRSCKGMLVSVVVLAASDTSVTYFTVDVDIDHGPDGQHYEEHTAGSAALSVSAIGKVASQGSGTGMLNEYIRVRLKGGSQSGKWAMVDVYEMRKPF